MKKRFLRFALLTLALAATALALFYAWADWAGTRRWKAVEDSLRAKGEPLTLAEMEPPPIEDDLNIAAAPIFAEIFRNPIPKQWRIGLIKPPSASYYHGQLSMVVNMARNLNPHFAGTDADAARLILQETAKWRPVLDEVRAAAQRPGTSWPTDYSKGFQASQQQVEVLFRLSRTLYADAIARLELGDSVGALQDFTLNHDLAGRAAIPPSLIGCLVSHSIVETDVGMVRYGLDRHRWSAPQLEAIQRTLAGISLIKGLAQSLRRERVMFSSFFQAMGATDINAFLDHRQENWGLFAEQPVQLLWGLRPSGWALDEKSYYAKTLQTWIDRLEAGSGPDLVTIYTTIAEPESTAFHLPVAEMALYNMAGAIGNTLRTQVKIDETTVACALERYRLAKGSLPSHLDDLVPAYLPSIPKDCLDGQPLRYRRLSGGGAVIYSVGPNLKDDGGVGPDLTHPSSMQARNEALDWVWRISD